MAQVRDDIVAIDNLRTGLLAEPVPEPSTLVIFGILTVLGFAVGRRHLRKA